MNTTLTQAVWPTQSVQRSVLLVLLGSLLMTLAAKFKVPFFPVPMTMQPLVVVLLGAAYGSRLGAATMVAYLAQGAIGLPVFAAGGGLVYLMGPTAGYLLGFVLAAFVAGWLAERGWSGSLLKTALAMLLGMALIYVPGLLVLKVVTSMSWQATFAAGLLPFLLGDLLKVVIATGLLRGGWHLLKKP